MQDKGTLVNTELVEDGLAAAPKSIEGKFRKSELPLPAAANECPGISLFGRVIRTLVFSTDIAIIRNCDADAVLAVYPFTCQPSITQALLAYAERPVFTGVAGAVTTGVRSIELAMQSEMQGATGVVANTASRPNVIRSIARSVDIPVVVTISELSEFSIEQINAGAQIVNVAAGKETPAVVKEVRNLYPTIPIIASGGKTSESIRATIAAGADAISWTPPTLQELERASMQKNAAIHKLSVEAVDEDESAVERDARLLKAVSRAAEGIVSMDEDRRDELIREHAGELDALFLERLDVSDRTMLRHLLFKLFNMAEPGSDEAAAQQADSDEGTPSDE